jgi:hypothetical protein
VLREELADEGLRLFIAKVVSVPDASHVRIDVQGSQVTVPRISGYVPQVNESVYCLAGNGLTIALGAASPAAIAPPLPGSATGQVPVWNAGTGRWEPQAKAPDAEALDGIDSTGYLQMMTSGTRYQVSGGRFTGSTNASGQTVHAHGLGRVPVIVTALPDRLASPATTEVMSANVDATNVLLQWVFSGGAIPGVGFSVTAWIMVIG